MDADLDQVAQWEKDMFGRFYSTNSEQADDMMYRITVAMDNRDEAALKELFSELAIGESDDMDAQIANLFDFYEGKMISYERYGPGSHSEKNEDMYYKKIFASYDIQTDSEAYRMTFEFCTIDSEHPDNLGILSIYIIKHEDDSTPDYAYWGPKDWEPGIHIEGKLLKSN
jgi:hypothetical protein